jgi:hypothetical protein
VLAAKPRFLRVALAKEVVMTIAPQPSALAIFGKLLPTSFVLPLACALILTARPAVADTVYTNGPINGTSDAWNVGFDHVVSNTFTVPSGGAILDGFVFAAWLFPGTVIEQAGEVSITDAEFGGNTFFDGFVNFTQSNCSGNQYGFNVCLETASFPPVHLAAGTYWLNLQNVYANLDDPAFWDENSGPSLASENSVGTIPSEAFTLLGTNGSTTSSTGTVPEPSSITLLGSVIIGVAGIVRHKWLST